MARTYHTFRLTDARLIDAFASITKALEAKSGNLNLRLDDQHPQAISCTIEQTAENPDVQKIRALQSTVLGDTTLSLGNPYNSSIRVKRDGVADTVTINFRNELGVSMAARVVQEVQTQLKPYERDDSFDKLLGDELAAFYRKREEGLVRLEELAQRIVERNEQYRTRLDQDAQAHQKNNREKYETLTKELDADYTRKDEELRKRQEAFEARLREIDDRSSRHVRRQIRQDLKAAIAQRGKEFTLTEKTIQKRFIVHGVFIALIGLLVTMLVISLVVGNSDAQGATQWFYLFRVPLLSLGAVAALIYYIRWNDNWFRRHADEEFRIKRFELDVDRASWLVEMAMEWKQEKGTDIPRELLDRLSANLFEKATEAEDARHPSEDMLSALLAASSELNLNIPGVGTVRLDRKGAKQFKEAVEKSE